MLEPEIVQRTTDKIKFIRDKLLTAKSQQKSYADQIKKPLEFREGEHVFLSISYDRGKQGSKTKLSPHFLGPYQILYRAGPIAYRLALLVSLSNLHDVFHVSQLKKYCLTPSHFLQDDSVQLRDDLIYVVRPAKMLDRSLKELRAGKTILLVKVLWEGLTRDEATQENEEDLQKDYPEIFN